MWTRTRDVLTAAAFAAAVWLHKRASSAPPINCVPSLRRIRSWGYVSICARLKTARIEQRPPQTGIARLLMKFFGNAPRNVPWPSLEDLCQSSRVHLPKIKLVDASNCCVRLWGAGPFLPSKQVKKLSWRRVAQNVCVWIGGHGFVACSEGIRPSASLTMLGPRVPLARVLSSLVLTSRTDNRRRRFTRRGRPSTRAAAAVATKRSHGARFFCTRTHHSCRRNAHSRAAQSRLHSCYTVSYTHLTLPTILLV